MAFFYLYSFGCKVNQAEGEQIAASLSQLGWQRVYSPSQANILIVNTCAVTSEAERKARKLIRRLKKLNASAFLMVTGCYAELLDSAKAGLPFDLLVSQKEKEVAVEKLRAALNQTGLNREKDVRKEDSFDLQGYSINRSRAFIKVQDGCEHFCSYCIVPYFRSKEKSLPLNEVVKMVKEASLRFKEVVLCGIRLGHYGHDLNPPLSLVELLRGILKETDVERVRLSSIELCDLMPELLNLLAEERRIASHLHLPLQSGDDEILKKMNRPYTAEQFIRKTEEIKQIIPDISLTTDIMLGFPGESERAFLNTVEVVKIVGFSRLHLFKFSPRPGTPASSFFPRVPEQKVERRLEILKKLDRELRSQYARKFISRNLEVIVEKKVNGYWEGLSENYLRVYFSSPVPLQFAKVFIMEEKEGSLFGKILKEKEEWKNGLSVLPDY